MPEPILERGKIPNHKPEPEEQEKTVQPPAENPLVDLQRQVGNRAVQRLIQRSGAGQTEIDEETAGRIDASRGSGQDLDPGVQESIGAAMGQDFSDVQVHTSPESDELNKQLGAEAFTTGNDVFFSDGSYDPHSGGGQELIAHELAHVVQQGSGQVGGSGGGMTVNEPGDAHEQEADSVAQAVVNAPVQRQGADEEEIALKSIQRQGADEEEIALKSIQRQGDVLEEEEEEPVQRQSEDLEEEEMLDT
jgi:hypothetical protein